VLVGVTVICGLIVRNAAHRLLLTDALVSDGPR
jgi:hypothetical protein